jgi:mono/diheme cytochrome c family protein
MRTIFLSAAMLPLLALGARALAADAPAGPPPGPGLDLINQRCVFCHNSAQIFSEHKTAPGWAATVEQMANRGAEVSPEEMKTIVDYLAKNYGASDQPATPAPPQH